MLKNMGLFFYIDFFDRI